MENINRQTLYKIIAGVVALLIVLGIVYWAMNKDEEPGTEEKTELTEEEIIDALSVPERENPELTEEEEEIVEGLSVPDSDSSSSGGNSGPSVSDSETERENSIVDGLSVE